MATRRMFSQQIVGSDIFLDMPASSRELYFQLGMYSDDDGFVSPQKVVRMVGATSDDLKVLLAKGFCLRFESGIVVITHWKQNNYIQKDRYTATIHDKEFNQLTCIHGVYNLDTQDRLGKVSIGRKEGRDIENISLEEIAKQVKQTLNKHV